MEGGAGVGYGVGGTDVVAGEAAGAIGAPGGTMRLLHGYVAEGTGAGAETAAGAAVGGVKPTGRHGVADEPGVYHGGFQPCK